MEQQLIIRRDIIVDSLSDLVTFFSSCTRKQLFMAKAKLDRLSNLESEFNDNLEQIIIYNSSEKGKDKQIEVKKVCERFYDSVDTVKSAFYHLTEDNNSQNSTTVTTASHKSDNLNLPKINIPYFDGHVEDWVTFHSLYESLIHHNNQLNNIQKHHYLRSYLKDEALAVVAQFELSEANYQSAYDALVARYHSERRLATFYLNQILNFSTSYPKSDFKTFYVKHRNAYSSLINLKINNLCDFIVCQLMYKNLDSKTQKGFDMKVGANKIPEVKELLDYIQLHAQNHELRSDSANFTPVKIKDKVTKQHSFISKVKKKETNYKCVVCDESHTVLNCKSYWEKPIEERHQIVKDSKLCFNCLGTHFYVQCQSKNTCKICNKKHHSSLHKEETAVPRKSLSVRMKDAYSLIGSMYIMVKNNFGTWQPVRAILDNASQINLVTTHCAKALGLKIEKNQSNKVIGVSKHGSTLHGKITCSLRSRFKGKWFSEEELTIETHIIDTISDDFPEINIPSQVYKRFEHLPLADKQFNKKCKVDMLLGVDVFCRIIEKDIIHGEPTAMKTKFGYVILGTVDSSTEYQPKTFLCLEDNIDEMLKSVWEQEASDTDEEDYCEEHFKATTYREDGRYVVSLPFKKNATKVGSNQQRATASLKFLNKKLEKENLCTPYEEFLKDYEEQGHMSVAKKKSEYILPHQCILRPDKSTTKIRIVFNGSSVDTTNISLNDRLLKGPKLQKDLSHLINSFRCHRIGLVCDVKQMFRQILIKPSDREFQHIIVQKPEGVVEYELNTVTYGLASSPYQASRCLLQLVEDDGQPYKLASHAIKSESYVDDFITGADSVEEACRLRDELIELLAKAKWPLRKWSSNSSEVLQDIPSEALEYAPFLDKSSGVKILGMKWEPKSDKFHYEISQFDDEICKRSVLSFTARLFDPMGFINPIVFWLKSYIQHLWSLKTNWDEPLSEELTKKFNQYLQQLSIITELQIPRFIPVVNNIIHLAMFSDASLKGYATVAYLQVQTQDQFLIRLLCCKSKVAPMKKLSIPRLELNGVVLMHKLCNHILESQLGSKIASVHYFTDSRVVLHWVHTPVHKLNTYVANRVSVVQNSKATWHYVVSEENPSDLASRGCLPNQLMKNKLWWEGPKFLLHDTTTWPKFQPNELIEDLPEVKSSTTIMLATLETNNDLETHIPKYSTLTKAVNVFAYVKRFVRNCQRKVHRNNLSVTEQHESLLLLCRVSQVEFQEDFDNIKNGKQPSKRLIPLKPFIDQRNVLRVGGRLSHSNLSYSQKHPIILSKHCHLSKLIIQHYHKISMHAGVATVMGLVRQKFWILSMRTLVKKVAHSCPRCIRFQKQNNAPMMADLPTNRVVPSRPFSKTSTDFCGPFLIKDNNLRKVRYTKSYVCVFICQASKSVHLELVSELTTKAFLAALDRFCSRRGLVSDLYSDNGTNYVGAYNNIKEVIQFLSKNEDVIFTSLATKHIKWHFSPPTSPHFNGLAEACVKSFKILFYKQLGNEKLTFEEMYTVLCRVEAVLNSRPLVPITTDSNDHILTPAHFLIQGPMYSVPETQLDDMKISPKQRWLHIKQISQRFWKQWHHEYLNTMSQRLKWNKSKLNVQLDQIVFIKDVNSSPLSWPMGRIIATHPGKDNVVRVVTIKTESGTFKRNVHDLVLVPKNCQ